MTASPPDAAESPVGAARDLLRRLGEITGGSAEHLADDLLLFCYRLRDGYRISTSTSNIISGHTFTALHELLYQLESKPDETLESPDWRTYIETLLRDIASGSIILARASNV